MTKTTFSRDNLGKGAEKILIATRKVAKDNPQFGVMMLLVAAAALCGNRPTFEEHCRFAADDCYPKSEDES